jgi:hypothetical protein
VVNKHDIEYNISKVQLMDPGRLGAMAQIGSTVFYLLFRIYNSKYTSLSRKGSVHHNASSKIGLIIFSVFFEFLRILQVAGKIN